MKPKLLIYAVGLVWAAALAKSFEFEEPWFRPWEMLVRGSSTHFAKNKRIEMTEFGNLAFRYWLREFREPHETVFTTDGWGFRNAMELSQAPRVVVIGDSFVVGSGLTDEDTLPAQLSVLLKEPVYNYGAQFRHGPPLYLSDPRFREFPPRVVIWAPSSTSLQPVIFPGSGEPKKKAGPSIFAPYIAVGNQLTSVKELIERDNGLGRFAKFTYHELSYRWFGLDEVISAGPNGELALVESVERQLIHQPAEERGAKEIAESATKFARLLEEKGTKLVFAPIPESGEIYADRFPEKERKKIARPSLLDAVFAELERNQIRSLDLRPLYRANREPYLYMRDDTHWNARTVALTAELFARELSPLLEVQEGHPLEQHQ